jgi:hypothetical protein
MGVLACKHVFAVVLASDMRLMQLLCCSTLLVLPDLAGKHC